MSDNYSQPIGYQSAINEFAGPYVADMLGKSWALSSMPQQTYGGPLTAGYNQNMVNAFTGIANLAVPTEVTDAAGNMTNLAQGYADFDTSITTPQFNQDYAQQYMNPYLQSALDPQLEEARRQGRISQLQDASRLTQAGAYGGSRQAIMESEQNRNMMDKQNQLLAQGYTAAYDRALDAFNKDMDRDLRAQQLEAQYGLAALGGQRGAYQAAQEAGIRGLGSEMDIIGEQARLGAIQRAAEQEAISADYAQFQQQRDYPYEQLQFMQSMLQGIPIEARDVNYAELNALQEALGGAAGISALLKELFPDGWSSGSSSSSATD